MSQTVLFVDGSHPDLKGINYQQWHLWLLWFPKGRPDKFSRTSSAPSFTTAEWWTHSFQLIEQTQKVKMYDVSEASAYVKKMASFSLRTFCAGPWAQALATEMSFKKIAQGTETLGPNRQGFPYQCHLFPWCTTLGTCIHSSSNYCRHAQHCTGQNLNIKVKEKCWALKEKDAVAAPDQWTNNYNTQCRDFRKKDMWNDVYNVLFLWTSVSPSEKWEWPQKCLSHTVGERHIKNSPQFISGQM